MTSYIRFKRLSEGNKQCPVSNRVNWTLLSLQFPDVNPKLTNNCVQVLSHSVTKKKLVNYEGDRSTQIKMNTEKLSVSGRTVIVISRLQKSTSGISKEALE